MTPQGREHESESAAGPLRLELIERIGSERFDLWFDRFASPRVVAGEVVVTAPDRFSLERIRRQFDGDLRRAMQGLPVSGLNYRVDSAESLKGAHLSENGQSHSGTHPNTAATNSAATSNSETTTNSGQPCNSGANINVRLNHSTGRNHSNHEASTETTHESASQSTALISDDLSQYVAGPHNRLAVAAALQVIRQPGSCTPLFIHGPTGTGKSWLLKALHGRALRERRFRSVSITAEQFTTGFLEALHGSGLPSFRAKHRDTDLLLLDDVHFFSGKRATLVEFLATIDRLISEGRQLVVTSNRAPCELTELGPELVARLGSGLVCGIDHASGAPKRDLIRLMASRKALTLNESMVELLDREVSGDARQISGAIHRLVALRMAGIEPTDPAEIRGHLVDLLQVGQASVGMHEIEDAVCETFGIDRASLKSSSKTRQCSQPRMLAMWLARRLTRAALSEIGDYFGGRRHSTVATAQRTVDQWMADDRAVGSVNRTLRVSEAVRRIERRLRCG